MRALSTLLITSLLVAGAACGGDDADTTDQTTQPTTQPTASSTPVPTDPTPSEPATTEPPVTEPVTTEPVTTEPPVTDPGTTEPVTTEPPATEPTEPPASVDVRVYFLRGERLVIDHREVDGPAVMGGAVTALLAGPSGDLVTAIPEGTELLGVNLVDGTATIDLSGEFASGGGSLSMTARVGQVVFTATQFDNVERVTVWLDGAPIEGLGGEGLDLSEPWTRADVARELTGGVLVDTPQPGATVTSPFTVTGEADVYEAQFPIEIRRGDEVLAVIAPVTGGAWGMWADFTTTVTVDAEPGPIELVAYDEGGCGDDPACAPLIETVVPLTLG